MARDTSSSERGCGAARRSERTSPEGEYNAPRVPRFLQRLVVHLFPGRWRGSDRLRSASATLDIVIVTVAVAAARKVAQRVHALRHAPGHLDGENE